MAVRARRARVGSVAVLDASAESADRERRRGRRLASLLAHELRSPLASIKTYADLLIGCPPESEEERREFLRTIADEAERLSRLIADVSDLERLEAGDWRVAPAPLSLADLASRAALAQHPLASRKRVGVNVDAARDARVAGDPRLLERAVASLVENAVKFSEEGGAVRVRVVAPDDESAAAIVVEDAGIGVPPCAAARVFEKFFQAAVPPDASSPRGSGLGLALVARIADLHEGTVAHRALAKGSAFTLTLPRLA